MIMASFHWVPTTYCHHYFYCYDHYFEKQHSQVKCQVWALVTLNKILDLSITPFAQPFKMRIVAPPPLSPYRGWDTTDVKLKLLQIAAWIKDRLRIVVLKIQGGNPSWLTGHPFRIGREKLVGGEKGSEVILTEAFEAGLNALISCLGCSFVQSLRLSYTHNARNHEASRSPVPHSPPHGIILCHLSMLVSLPGAPITLWIHAWRLACFHPREKAGSMLRILTQQWFN